jgi:hypothetical protein
MESLIINIKTAEEKEFITQLLRKLGINSISLKEYEFQKRLDARKKFAELVPNSQKINITDEEIDAIVEEVRAKRYAEKNNH